MRAAATWGLMIGLSGAAAPAWAAPPSESPAEPVAPLTEPQPVTEPTEPVPEPALETPPETPPEPVPAPTPAPAQPERPLPAYDAPLPSYDEIPIAPDVSFHDLPNEVEDPPTGRGLTTFGSIMLGGGVALTAVSATMLSLDTDSAVWFPGAVIGSAAIVTGVTLVVTGHLRHERYRVWADAHANAPVPPTGNGLLVGGMTCMFAGTMGVAIGASSLVVFQTEDDPPYGQVLVPLGVATVVTGVGLLVGAGKRRKAFSRWQVGSVVPSLSMLPGARQSIGGLSLGFAGRF